VPGRFPPPVWLAPLLVAATVAAPAQAAPCRAGATDRSAVVCELNAARAGAGLGPLQSRPSLAEAARAHADDMVARQFFSHVSPEGESAATRARRAGYLRNAERWRIGEVLIWRRGGTPLTAAAAVTAWLGSPSHRQILLSPRYRDVGAGVVAGAPFGDPARAPAATFTVVFGRRD